MEDTNLTTAPESKRRFLASRCDEYGLAALWDRDRHELTFWFRRWPSEPNTYWICAPVIFGWAAINWGSS